MKMVSNEVVNDDKKSDIDIVVKGGKFSLVQNHGKPWFLKRGVDSTKPVSTESITFRRQQQVQV